MERINRCQGSEGGNGKNHGSLKTEEKNIFDREILNVEEAADFLRLSTKSVYKHARYGALPHQRIGSKYIFLRSELIRFLKGE